MNEPKNDGLRILGTVLAMAAVVGAIIFNQGQSASQQNQILAERLAELTRRVEKFEAHVGEKGHPDTVLNLVRALETKIDIHSLNIAEIHAIKVNLTAFDTRMEELVKVADNVRKGHEKRLDRIEANRMSWEDAPQWERIKALERSVYGK